MSEKPCCPAAAGKTVKKLDIDGVIVGVSGLDAIIGEVLELKLDDEKEIKKELLDRVKSENYVNPKREEAYAEALLKEYYKLDDSKQ